MKSKNNLLSLSCLVKRNIKLFLKDKMLVLFSVLAPLIILILYIFFLTDLQVGTIENVIKEAGIDGIDPKLVTGFLNNWMLSGVMAVSCITVAFNVNTIMVRDRERGSVNDVLAAPVKRWVIYASYIITCFVLTFCICFIVLLVALIYLACTGGFMMSFVDFLAILGITIFSIVSSSFISVFLVSFMKTEGSLGAFNGIFAAAIGFLIGAYLPLSILPKPVQYFVCFIPGAYSAGLFRNYFLRGPMEKLLEVLPGDVVKQLMGSYSVQMEFFGTTISSGWMVFALAISIIVFVGLLIIFYSNKKTNFFALGMRKKKKKK